ncbi:PREDICTED: putative neutral ceramidase C [Priapulus caudatus]|uniref:Neutral ceramidase n=1 Tax=Priapulus caudatus TaxID=37621 RepID=A0ABM1DN73_PRICU|nr:PREDICTED: putative neutral ceramidase C [Priapulus caudatus]
MVAFVLLLLAAVAGLSAAEDPNYYIGTGIYDITGPAGGIPMMGYAKPGQLTGGIHLRLFARAYVVAEMRNINRRTVFVSCDMGMASQLVTMKVFSKLKTLFGADMYTKDNVVISGTHTHSGPGGYLQYAMYGISTIGFIRDSFDIIVDGIVESIRLAHHDLRPGSIYYNEGELLLSNINRSPTSYVLNPKSERARYNYDVDKTMWILKMVDGADDPIGIITWFAVHPTSMNNSNHLISGDNKGYASYLFEQKMNPGKMPGKGKFTAAFASSNLGDVSPNTAGPRCLDTGELCDLLTSTCNGKHNPIFSVHRMDSNCVALWTRWADDDSWTPASIDFRHQFVNMSNVEVEVSPGEMARTCAPAMGYSFAAGTTDGPGSFNFTQGTTEENEFWSSIVDAIAPPSEQLKACQAPKPVLLATGEISFPYAWQPSIVEIQMLRIGQFVSDGSPGEFTTMSGRRLRESVAKTLVNNGFPEDTKVVLAGLSGTTPVPRRFEGSIRGAQRYEAASTIFGPHTLSAYMKNFILMAEAMSKGEAVDQGPNPPDLEENQLELLLLNRTHDSKPVNTNYGDVLEDASDTYIAGESVVVKFQSGHPRNNAKDMIGGTYITVDNHPANGGSPVTVKTDAHWDTTFSWKVTKRDILTRGKQSELTVTWNIPIDTPPGAYSITHYGQARTSSIIGGEVTIDYQGTSKTFQVVSARRPAHTSNL